MCEDVIYLKYADKNKQFKHIIHLSDIHIRTGDPEKARYDEYIHVFQNLINDLNNKDLDDALIVITGDLFHHKGKIEPSGVKLINYLIYNLTKIAPTIVICGNHDYRQDYPEIPDMIESLLQLYKRKCCFYYLNKTGKYIINNIGLGVVDIRDTMKSYDTFGRRNDRIEFPNGNEIKGVEYKIALFHGLVNNDFVDKNEQCYPIDWFNGYSHILLGDVHKYSAYSVNNVNIGYPGSLIQQHFGETPMEHGYLDWNLKANNVTFNKVYNQYGMITVKKYNDIWHVHHNKRKWLKLEDIENDEFFPKNPIIRMNRNDNDDNITFTNKDIVPQKVIKTLLKVQEIEEYEDGDMDIDKTNSHLTELNTKSKWIEYLKTHTGEDFSKYIEHPENLKIPDICKEIKNYTERNNKIQKSLNEYIDTSTDASINKYEHVEFVNMQWSYLMCYGEDNHIDFTALENKTALLNGRNAMGKSSFLDIMCLGLYGEATKMRNVISGKKYTNKIIHDRIPKGKTAYVDILLKMNKDKYEIHRSFGTQTGTNTNQIRQCDLRISKFISEDRKQVICEGNTLVSKWIEKNIGSMESVLMSTMICQMDLNNFFHLKQEDQKLILDSALNLESVSMYGEVLKTSLLAHNDILKQIRGSIDTVNQFVTNDETVDINIIENNYNNAKQEYDKHLQLKEEWLTKIFHKNWKDITVTDDIIDKYRDAKDLYEYQFNKKEYDKLEKKSIDMVRIEEQLKQSEINSNKYTDITVIKNADKLLEKWQNNHKEMLTQKPETSISKEWVSKTNKEYQEWYDKQNKNWLSMEEKETFDKEINAKLDNLWKASISKPSYTKPKISFDYDNVDIDDIILKYERLEQKKPNKVSNKGYDEWKQKYNKWININKEFITWEDDKHIVNEIANIESKLQNLQENEEKLLNTQKELKEYENVIELYKDLKFNPHCNECNNNPFKIKKDNAEENYKETKIYYNKLTKFVDKLKTSIENKKYKSKLEEYKTQLDNYKKYTMEKDYYNLENERWDDINYKYNEYKKWCDEYATVKDIYELHQWNKYEEWKSEYSNTLKEKQDWEIFYKSYNSWNETLQEIEKQNDLIKLLSTWEYEEKIVLDKINKYSTSIEKKQADELYSLLKNQYDDISNDVEKWRNLKQIKDDYELYSSHYAIYKIKEFEPTLINCKKTMDNCYSILLKARQDIDKQLEYAEKIGKYKEMETIINEKYNYIKELETNFIGDKNSSDGYKEWIYKDKVIPLLNKEMNEYLSSFEDFRFKMIYEKCRFIYLLQDRGNEPTLDKASGYQNFIVSLAFRLALTKIGAIGQQLKHLFIDEGFTACDSNNIERIHMILKSIKNYGKYKSIILMSHLDAVRECSQVSINIERNDPYSYIRYGNDYPIIDNVITPEGDIITTKKKNKIKC